MCGRYVRRSDKQKIAEYFHATPQPSELPMPDADYNIAPTTYQPTIRQNRETGEREMVLARWGLVPFFTKSLKEVKGLSTINARAESIMKARLGVSLSGSDAASFPQMLSMSGRRRESRLSSLTHLS